MKDAAKSLMSIDELIDKILLDQPAFHAGETETGGEFDSSRSFLHPERKQAISSGMPLTLGIGRAQLEQISQKVNENTNSLEIGLGFSTVVFSALGRHHTTITPFASEVEELKKYADSIGLNLNKTSFIIGKSEDILPKLSIERLDVVLIDGKHAFPWPFIDWFYSVRLLKKNGILVIDDVQIPAVELLSNYLKTDENWSSEMDIDGKTHFFRKKSSDISNVAWHMQDFNRIKTPILQKLKNRSIEIKKKLFNK